MAISNAQVCFPGIRAIHDVCPSTEIVANYANRSAVQKSHRSRLCLDTWKRLNHSKPRLHDDRSHKSSRRVELRYSPHLSLVFYGHLERCAGRHRIGETQVWIIKRGINLIYGTAGHKFTMAARVMDGDGWFRRLRWNLTLNKRSGYWRIKMVGECLSTAVPMCITFLFIFVTVTRED